MHEGVYNFGLEQILLKSSFQNLGLLVWTITCQVFSLNLTVRRVFNKHCLLTFFIYSIFTPISFQSICLGIFIISLDKNSVFASSGSTLFTITALRLV